MRGMHAFTFLWIKQSNKLCSHILCNAKRQSLYLKCAKTQVQTTVHVHFFRQQKIIVVVLLVSM